MNRPRLAPLPAALRAAWLALAFTAALAFAAPRTRGGEPTPIAIAAVNHPGPVDFAREILPILTRNCLACHNPTDAEAGLVLESPESIRKGGDSGPAVTPGNGATSRLLRAAAHQEADLVMPPSENKVGAAALTSEQLGLVKLWIDQGAAGETAPTRVIARRPVPASIRAILATAITPDDELVACSRGNRLFAYDLRSQQLAAELVDPALATAPPSNAGSAGAAHEDLIRSLAFDRQAALLAAGGFRTVKIWRRPLTKSERELTTAAAVRCQAVSPDGSVLALGSEAGGIELGSRDGKSPAKTIAAHGAAVTGLAFAPDGKRLYSASLDKTVKVWDVATGAPARLADAPRRDSALSLSDSGTHFITADGDNSIRVWTVDALASPPAPEPPMPLRELKGHAAPIVALAVPATPGDRLISASQEGRLKIWNLADGAQVRELDHGGPLGQIAASPDGERIVSVGTNGIVRLWNPADGALVIEIKSDPRAIRDLQRADAALNYARACVEYRKEEHREAEEAVKRETTAMEGGQKNKADTEKSIADKTDPAAKLAEAAQAADKMLTEAEAGLKDATDKRTVAKTALDAGELAENQARKAAADARCRRQGRRQRGAGRRPRRRGKSPRRRDRQETSRPGGVQRQRGPSEHGPAEAAASRIGPARRRSEGQNRPARTRRLERRPRRPDQLSGRRRGGH